jgi:hypothetical protein
VLKLSDLARNVAIDEVCALLNGGALRLHDATGRKLATLAFSSPAFDKAVSGRATARQIVDDPQAENDGYAVEYRAFTAKGEELFIGQISPPLLVKRNVVIGLKKFVYEQG